MHQAARRWGAAEPVPPGAGGGGRLALGLGGLLLVALALGGCRQSRPYPNRPIFLICPWAAGGGTDRLSRQTAALLEQELGVPVNVVNATGGGGVTGHTRGALARPDGYTITMVTVEINMLHWRGLTNISYQDFTPLGMLNRDPAAVFVRADAPWQTLQDLEQHIREHPGRVKAAGTAAGGIWHLGFAGWLDAVGLDPGSAIWVSINGAAPSLQELLAGGVDVVCCSMPEAQPLLESGRIRALGVMADERSPAFADTPTLREQGVDWTLYGWRGVCGPKGLPPAVAARLTQALERVVRSDAFRRFMNQSGFTIDWQPPEQFARTMAQMDQSLGRLLTSDAFRHVRQVRFGPLFFPSVVAVLLGVVLLALLAGAARRAGRSAGAGLAAAARNASDGGPAALQPGRRQELLAVAEVGLCVVAYLVLAERLGFVLTAAALMAWLLWRLGAGWRALVAAPLVLAPLLYQLFAVWLRVPLPRGWFGW